MVMVLSWCITLNTKWQMIQLHKCMLGVRFDHYYELGRHAFGPKLGSWIVLSQQLIVQVGGDIVYMVTRGEVSEKVLGNGTYSTMAWVGCLSRGRVENVSYAYKESSGADYMFRVFNALGQISSAYAGHAVVLEIQATIPSTPKKPSKVAM
ncbi:lysine histidine transporter-like 6 [Cornus florida]|uniref:lysine histidine transporter-like 6 n=1 Tax=Cornus florida TaxID=4283 RepID=UPI00289951D4|nr:lysine histidine transporter-like 6 [Cornus florida]